MSDRSILVGVDFGPTSARAFATAVDLAARLGAPLDIVHVRAPSPGDLAASGAASVDRTPEELRALAQVAEQQGLVVRTHCVEETVILGLIETVRELEPQLVVVGSHGRHGLSRAIVGSVSDALARQSPVPVVIVPPPERKQPAEATAWACARCGHILGDGEGLQSCTHCGVEPASWTSAPLTAAPADVGEPSVGEPSVGDLAATQTQSAGGLFATAPAGVEGIETNAELRVRY